jgi:hypothetical protein
MTRKAIKTEEKISMMTLSEKVHENRLRRHCQRRGLRLERKRRYDPYALDYGVYRLIDEGRGARMTPKLSSVIRKGWTQLAEIEMALEVAKKK